MAPPLFIVGTSRSGTSWAFDLCASHPDMSMGYESKLPIEGIEIYRRHRATLNDRAGFDSFFHSLKTDIDDPSSTAVTELLSQVDVINRAYEAHNNTEGWASICEAIFCSLEGTTHWGNKLLRIELTPTLIEQWPEARFLILTRDPRGVMASQSQKFDHSLDYSAMYWNTHARFVLDRIGTPPDYKLANHRVIDLVEMARDPRPTLEWAFESLSLDTAVIDDLITRFPGDPDRLDKWRMTIAPKPQRLIEEYCFDAMSELGYTPELAQEQRELTRLRRVVAMVREHGGELLRDPASIRRKQVGRRIKSALRSRT